MKVLLIVPTYNYSHHYPCFVPSTLFPTGFAYLASSLKAAGHTVIGLNPNNIIGYPSARAMLRDNIYKVLEEKPDLVGLGGLCTEYAFLKDAISFIRKTSDAPVVLGGRIMTHDPEFIFNQLKPDFGIVGEGEGALVELSNILDTPGKVLNSSLDRIQNLYYWRMNEIVFTGVNHDYGDINLRPFPDYEPFNIENMFDYVMAANWWYRYSRPYPRPWTIITARSCPFSCTFCVHHQGPKYRARSIENIIEEIRVSYDRYKFNILIMMDELFAVNNKRMNDFCNALAEAKDHYGWDFDWAFQTHASANLDKTTLELARQYGCYFYSYGMESASPRVLESMNKKTKPEQIVNAIQMARDTSLCFAGNFIFGDPAETPQTMQESVKFLVDNCTDTNTMVAALRPYPGSKVFDVCIEKGIIRDKLNFYEHIDEDPWNMRINMTAVPDRKWLPLLDSVVAFSQLFPWVEPVVPYFYDEDICSDPVGEHTGRQMYGIAGRCPYCGNSFFTRELLPLKSVPVVSDGKTDIKVLTKLVWNALVKAARLANVYYFSFQNPIFRLLRSSVKGKGDLIWNSFFGTVWFITDCPHCNRIIKVTIPVPFSLKMFSFTEIKRKFRLI